LFLANITEPIKSASVATIVQTTSIPQGCRRLLSLAERDPRRAVILTRRAFQITSADGSSTNAWASYTLGWALLWWERFDEARQHLRAARELFVRQDHRLDTLHCDYALLLADLFQHARPNLEQDLTALAVHFEQVGALSNAARTRLYQAILFDILGRPQDASALLDQIAPVIADGPLTDRARWLYIRGAVAISRGDYADAELLLAQAEQFFATLHNPLERAKCWFQQAWAALRQEKLDLALANYRRAEHVFVRLDLPVRLALSKKGIGLLFSRQGLYEAALSALLTALRLFTTLQRMGDIGGCQLNLGNIYFYTGQWDIAEAYYRRAEAIYETAGIIGARIATRRNRAMVYHHQGRFVEARTLLTEVEAEALLIGDQDEVAAIWAELAGLLGAEGHYEKALLQYRRAGELFVQLGNPLSATICLVDQGWVALQQGQVDQAYALFCSAEPLISPDPYGYWRMHFGLARCKEIWGDVEEALLHYHTALATIAKLRRQLVSEEISSSLYAQAEQLHADALRLAVDQGAVEAALEIGEGQRALVLQHQLASPVALLPMEYRQQGDQLRAKIAALLANEHPTKGTNAALLDAALVAYGDLLLHARHSAPTALPSLDLLEPAFTLASLREHLHAVYGTDWLVLNYILSGGVLLIGTITPEGATIERVAYDQRLQRLIAQATQPSYRRYTYLDLPLLQGQSDRPWADLHELAARLLPDSLRAQLHPRRRLLIVPAGPLHALPWAALRLDDCWLAERAIVQIAPALSAWQALASQLPIQTTALLVGCSSFGERMPALPAVGAELDAVAARWSGTHEQLRDGQATQAALLERAASGELARYGLLHIASHARLLPARGRAAHLKLWDGDLLLSEIASLRLGGALVVLSACDGAAADALPGEEVLSLSWAFLAAGASAVLASLWPVGDSAVVRIMAAFYSALRQHSDAALALAQVQRELIAAYSEDDSATEPTGWGSFVLHGR
jgi:tetratricopeptide (TPR) repeat protein